MKNLTIKDIAKIAGVSPTAVSFVLNNRSGVSQETRDKIKLVIEHTGFSPNVHTRRLNLKRSFNLNLAIRQNVSAISNLFYIEILMGIMEASKDFSYNIVLSDISDIAREKRLLINVHNSDTDGIIFLQDPSTHLLSEVSNTKIPFLVVDSQLLNPKFPSIRLDYVTAARTSVEYLISKGHKAIAYIGMETNPKFYVNTFNGYKQAMEAADLSFMPSWIQPSAFDEASSYKCMDHILHSRDIPTAVYCSSDVLAYSSMQCAKDCGLSIPDDISFIGMDNIQLSKYTQPPLSTLLIDSAYMSRSAIEMIDKMINGKEYDSILLSSDTIIERGSVKDLTTKVLK